MVDLAHHEPEMGTFFFIVLIALVLGVAIVKHNQKVNAAWTEAAAKLRLHYDNSGGGARSIRGDRVDLSIHIRTKAVNKSTHTCYEARFPEALPFALKIAPQSFLSDVTSAFLNRIDVETGDAAFDRLVIVESDSPEEVRNFLSPPIRAKIKEVINRFDSVEISNHRVLLDRHRLISDSSLLVEDARVLESASRLILRETLLEAELEEDEGPRRVPPPLPDRTTEGPTVMEETESAEEVSEVAIDLASPVIDPEAPSLPEIGDSQEPGSSDETVFEIIDEPEPAEASGGQHDAFTIRCLDYFRECSGRYDFLRTFNEELKGEFVESSARLDRVEAFSMDRVFGRGPGVRRYFSLGRLENGDELTLVADSPADSRIGEWRAKCDSITSFSGELVAADAFETTLFLKVPVMEDLSAPPHALAGSA